MKTIKKVSAKSIAKLFGLMYAIFGFVFGLFMMVLAIVGASGETGLTGVFFGIAAPIFLTLIYGLMGWIGGWISGWLYNFLAKKVGGIQFEID